MRVVLLACVLLCGCSPSGDYSGVYADFACETAYAVLKLRGEIAPTPPPAPPASDKCDNCNGTGIIGDGRVKIQCPECKGTGKRMQSVLIRNCPDGKCKP